MHIETFVADALGDASHVLVHGGVAAVVDPQRDVRPYLAAAERAGARLAYVFETHVHNDYLSGGRELAALGAEVVAPAAANLEFPHRALSPGDVLHVGGVALAAFASPGHTYEHAAYLATPAGQSRPLAAFTGGSLLMGSAGRSDLLGPEHAAELARLQWQSAHALASALPGEAVLYPTHGAGSFCTAGGGVSDRFGALATEQDRNPALRLPTVQAFMEAHLAPAPTPGYYPYMAPINRRGPVVRGAVPRPPRLDADRLANPAGTVVLDIRGGREHAAGAVPGSLLIEFGPSMLAYVGWLVPFDAPIALVSADAPQAETATVDLFRIGYEHVVGYIAAPDIAADRLRGSGTVSAREVALAFGSGDRPVLDVRFRHEQEASPLPGALAAPIDELPHLAPSLPAAPVLVVCESGYRSATAASYLRRLGREATPLLGGGVSQVWPELRRVAS
jgi:hydroxyacylglutathione hydrolase